jgi:thiamine biosynthesis protein ThiS
MSQTNQPLHLTLNGEPRTAQTGDTVADLLRALNLPRETVAVERNRDVVRRADHATTLLADGDVIELVQFVGGGA